MSELYAITGASSGIGRATAIALAAAKPEAKLLLVGRHKQRLEEAATACGQHAEIYVADLENLEHSHALALKAAELAGEEKFHFVLAHGIGQFGDSATMAWPLIEQQLSVNLIAPMAIIHAALPSMLKAGGGHIVNVLSITSEIVFPQTAAYSASKAGLRMYGKVIAAEYRKKGIMVTNILPGAVDTPIWDGMTSTPDRTKMLRPEALAAAIVNVLTSPFAQSLDEITIMPAHGIL